MASTRSDLGSGGWRSRVCDANRTICPHHAPGHQVACSQQCLPAATREADRSRSEWRSRSPTPKAQGIPARTVRGWRTRCRPWEGSPTTPLGVDLGDPWVASGRGRWAPPGGGVPRSAALGWRTGFELIDGPGLGPNDRRLFMGGRSGGVVSVQRGRVRPIRSATTGRRCGDVPRDGFVRRPGRRALDRVARRRLVPLSQRTGQVVRF
jgi:hypothetical protein